MVGEQTLRGRSTAPHIESTIKAMGNPELIEKVRAALFASDALLATDVEKIAEIAVQALQDHLIEPIKTWRPGDPPLSCQHHHIDNGTGKCVACGEQMIGYEMRSETVLSAPNLASCANPACKQALADGTYDDADPPDGCSNPHGVYIPDQAREREVTLWFEVSYQCERCVNGNDMVISGGSPIVYPCGMDHRGDNIPCTERAPAL